jgi:hypothetical protein
VPSIAYGTGAYRRTNGNFPELKLINMYVEKSETSENKIALLSRPGLGELVVNGSGPINALLSKKGTLNGDVFSISGSALYRGTSAVASGTIAGTGPASMDGNATELLITRGSTMRSYADTGTPGIANVAFPDGSAVRAVCFIGSLFVAVRGDTQFPGRFYWSDLLDGRTWDALNYATAERESDALLDIAPLGDNVWLFGAQTIEAWSHTGAADLPFTRLENVAFDKGIMATGCVAKADNGLFFVGSNRSVYRVSDVPQRISDHAIEERILASATAKLFTFQHEGHEFVVLRLDTETLAYDCATQEWCEMQSSGGQWIVSCACMVDDVAYLGHSSTGQIMGWSEWDDLGQPLERRFTAAQQLDAPYSINSVKLWVNAGQTALLEGTGSEPIIEMSFSDDAGNTWSAWEADSLGATGDYRAVPEWRALGQFDFPGAIMDFRCSDPVPLRISAVKINDPGGKRA